MRRRSYVFILLLTAMASSSLAAAQSSPIVNLALGKLATQSSTDTVNGIQTTASLAVDGNTDGDIAHGSVAQTQTEATPWWEVDLGEIAYIDTIQVYIRSDNPAEYKQSYVFISEVPFASTDLTVTLNQPGVTHPEFQNFAAGGVTLAFQRTARYVRIQANEPIGTQLQLAEVQVLGMHLSDGMKVVGKWETMQPLHNTADTDEATQHGTSLNVGYTSNTLSLVHVSLLPSKKLLFWGRDKIPDTGGLNDIDDLDGHSDAYLLDWDLSKLNDDPTTPQDDRLMLVPNCITNMFCAGHSFLRNGNLFVAGGAETPVKNGAKDYTSDGNGVRQTYIFDDSVTKQPITCPSPPPPGTPPQVMPPWSAGPDMKNRRWYPSLVTLSNGETLILTGDYVTYPGNQPQINYNTDTEILGRDMTTLRPGAPLPVGLPSYPFMHIGPDGKVLVVSGESQQGLFYDPSADSWQSQTNLNLQESHLVGTSVMYDKGKIMVIGGRSSVNPDGLPTRSTETIDLNPNPSDPRWIPQWKDAKPMNFARYYATSVLMPDGKIFIVGGSACAGANNVETADPDTSHYQCRNGAVMYPEIYDPASDTWSIMAKQQTIRMYHSVALLLPDATILVAGGGRPGAYGEVGTIKQDGTEDKVARKYLAHHEVEIFSPPYLFDGNGMIATRPAITTDPPSTITYGQSFNLGIGSLAATQIQQVVLVRLPSVTHALNFDQRRVVLAYQVLDQQTLSITVPASGTEAPPGPYMLFVIGPNGVPSEAKIITSLDNAACSSPPAPLGLLATALSSTQVNITWTAPNAPVDHYELDRKQSFSAPFVKIADIAGSTTTYADLSVAGSIAYLYQVRAVCSLGSSSQPSNTDLATTISFTDDPLIAGVTNIKAQHINELRSAVNAVRVTAGLAQAAWTDASLQGIVVKVVHITELRQNLNQALQAMGFTPPTYTDSALSPGVIVKKAHIDEVRQALR